MIFDIHITMKGILIIYNNADAQTITQYNKEIFGKVVRVVRKKKDFYYYYPGILNTSLHYRLSKGCWFIPTESISPSIINKTHLKIISTDLEIDENELYTAQQYFRQQYMNKMVNNLE